jgi:hypothetical protein
MQLDMQLIFAARQLITGANVHRLNTLMFQYEMAVRISNEDASARMESQAKEYEYRLRTIVGQQRQSRAHSSG